jgi:hypothetical protein
MRTVLPETGMSGTSRHGDKGTAKAVPPTLLPGAGKEVALL